MAPFTKTPPAQHQRKILLKLLDETHRGTPRRIRDNVEHPGSTHCLTPNRAAGLQALPFLNTVAVSGDWKNQSSHNCDAFMAKRPFAN